MIISILKNTQFSGKGRQSLHIYVMRIHKMLISYVRLEYTVVANKKLTFHFLLYDC